MQHWLTDPNDNERRAVWTTRGGALDRRPIGRSAAVAAALAHRCQEDAVSEVGQQCGWTQIGPSERTIGDSEDRGSRAMTESRASAALPAALPGELGSLSLLHLANCVNTQISHRT